MFGRSAVTSRIISTRSSGSNSRFLDTLTPTTTMISSNSGLTRSMTSRCPQVTGSNEPGQTARLTVGDRTKAVPEHGVAVTTRPVGLHPVRPAGLRVTRGTFDDQHGR